MLPPRIQSDIAYLLTKDAAFKASGVAMPDFSWRTHDAIFPSLMRTIVGQQLSTKAANTIWQRVADGVGELTPTGFMALEDDVLRGYGLSRQKISYVRGLAMAVAQGQFIPDALHDMEDEQVLAQITSLKGFGVWSAQMVLIFTLNRTDIWPSGDLGIREGVKIYHRLDERPDIATTEKYGDRFKGRRTAAALLMWKMKDTA